MNDTPEPIPETIPNQNTNINVLGAVSMIGRLITMGAKGPVTLPMLNPPVTIDEYRDNLEKNFTDEMTWDNFNKPGGWYIKCINDQPASNRMYDINALLSPKNVIPVKIEVKNETNRQDGD